MQQLGVAPFAFIKLNRALCNSLKTVRDKNSDFMSMVTHEETATLTGVYRR